jgi:hypothetical protein
MRVFCGIYKPGAVWQRTSRVPGQACYAVLEANMETDGIDRVINYLTGKKVFNNINHVSEINVGSGGAKLFFIENSRGKYVLKISGPSADPSLLQEYKFYSTDKGNGFNFLPEIIYNENHSRYGAIIVMKQYKPIKHEEWNYDLQLEAADLCAKLNSLNKGTISNLGLELKLIKLDREFLKKSYSDWKYIVLKYNNRLVQEPGWFSNKSCKMLRILLFSSGSCSETEVSKQLY